MIAAVLLAAAWMADPPPINLTPGAPAASREVVEALTRQDRLLFDAVFGCTLDALPGMLADDFEFVHDKWGRSARPQFLDAIAQGCQRQKAGTDFKARRELVPGTMTVHLINNYGALQMGTHRFFAIREGQKDRLTESGRFIHLWKLDNGTWTLARAISYDHQLAK